MFNNRKNILYFVSLIFPIVILSIVYTIMEIIPFGGNSLLTIDLNGQYISYFSYFKNSIINNDSLIYSISKTMTGEMVGLTAYYLLSPFNFILLFFELENFPIVITLLTLIKTGFSGLTMYYYLINKNGTSLSSLLLSTSYALSGYVIVYQQNLMWLDGVIFLPLIIIGIDYLYSEKKKWVYPLFLAASLITNYYIGYMICIFSVLYFISTFIEEILQVSLVHFDFKKFLKTTIFYVFGSLLAGVLAAIVLIPTYLSLQGGKAEFDFTVLMNNDVKFTITDFISKFVIGAFNYQEIKTGMPNVYVSYFALISSFLFLFNNKIELSAKVKYLLLMLFMYISFTRVGINLLWHGLNEPVWFPYRYSFIFSFIIISMAGRHLSDRNENKAHIIGILLLGLISVYSVAQNDYSFLSLNKILLTIFYLLVWGIFYIRVNKKTNIYILSLISFIVIASELSLNSFLTLRENEYVDYEKYSSFVAETLPVVEKYKPKENEFYRLEKNYQYSHNDPLLFGYSGLSHYSSSEKTRVKNFLGEMGYRNNGNWARYSYGSTLFSDSYMGVKYIFSKEEIMRYNLIDKVGPVYVYENPHSFPLGFVIKNQATEKLTLENPFEYQNKLIWLFTETEDHFKKVDSAHIEKKVVNLDTVDSNKSTFAYKKRNMDKEAFIHYHLTGVKNKVVNFYLPTSTFNHVDVFVDGIFISEHLSSFDHTINVFLANKNKHTVTLKLKNEDIGFNEELFYVNELDSMERIYEQVMDTSLEITKFSSTNLEGNINGTTNENSTLVLSIPFDDGWEAKIDGMEVETTAVLNSVLGVKLPKDASRVELTFNPKGYLLGKSISLVSMFIFILVAVLPRIRKK